MKEHVAIVIKNPEGKILFIQRSSKKKTLPDCWSFPSGTVEDEESYFQTAVRESEEELGIKVIPIKNITTAELPEFGVKLIFVLCKIKKGNPIIMQPEENQDFAFETLDNFFANFSDDKIGHGLIWIRKNRDLFLI